MKGGRSSPDAEAGIHWTKDTFHEMFSGHDQEKNEALTQTVHAASAKMSEVTKAENNGGSVAARCRKGIRSDQPQPRWNALQNCQPRSRKYQPFLGVDKNALKPRSSNPKVHEVSRTKCFHVSLAQNCGVTSHISFVTC